MPDSNQRRGRGIMPPLFPFQRRRAHLHPALRRRRDGVPVLRVDDYPTGVRPLLADLGSVHQVLREIEARGLAYHLGIVPARLTEAMAAHLATLRHMIPVVHGHGHGLHLTPLLVAAGDPLNQRRTVGEFDEFAGLTFETIKARLAEARYLVEERLGRSVTGYIPPCNRAGRTTGRALVETGYTHYFSERRIPGCPLPGLASDFYGRSDSYRPGSRCPRVVTLHATWEADLLRDGNERSLARLLDHLAACAAAAPA